MAFCKAESAMKQREKVLQGSVKATLRERVFAKRSGRGAHCLSPQGESMQPQRSERCRPLKKRRLLRCPPFSSLNVRAKYVSLLDLSGVLHPAFLNGRIKYNRPVAKRF